MFVRVVRFTGVDADRVAAMQTQVDEAGGPPEGVRSTGLQMLFDESQGTAVVLQLFETAQDMEDSAKIFAAMDPAQTPGTRVSVDECEMKIDVSLSTAR